MAHPPGSDTRASILVLDGAQHQDRSAHGFHQFVRRFELVQMGGLQIHAVFVVQLDLHADMAEQRQAGADVLELGQIFQTQRFSSQQTRAKYWQSCIFGT
jgi:hypothetical protein